MYVRAGEGGRENVKDPLCNGCARLWRRHSSCIEQRRIITPADINIGRLLEEGKLGSSRNVIVNAL